tara:strand:- start:98 stop:736 length:639 start_codon:yes stop_codon:yes gene_type:complete
LVDTIGTQLAPFAQNNDYTISGWFYADNANTLDLKVVFTDNPATQTNAQTIIAGGTAIATLPAATWTYVEYTFNTGTVAPIASNTCLGLSFNNDADGGPMSFSEIKLEEGATATPFTRAGNNIAGELAMCQRYYCRGDTDVLLSAYATVGMGATIVFPQSMRVAPALAVTTVGYTSSPSSITVGGFVEAVSSALPSASNPKYVDSWIAEAEL